MNLDSYTLKLHLGLEMGLTQSSSHAKKKKNPKVYYLKYRNCKFLKLPSI